MYINRENKYFIYLYFLDCSASVLAFWIANLIRFSRPSLVNNIYFSLLAIILFSNVFVDSLTENLSGFFSRGYYLEFISVIKFQCINLLFVLFYMFAIQVSAKYSRLFIGIFIVFNVLLTYYLRIGFKRLIIYRLNKNGYGTKLAIITTKERMLSLLPIIEQDKMRDYWVTQIALIDHDEVGTSYGKFEITCNKDNFAEVFCKEVVDEVFVDIGSDRDLLYETINKLNAMGIVAHIVLDNLGFDTISAKTGLFLDRTVLTISNNTITHTKLLQKRFLDICGAIVGITITIFVGALIIPMICVESKGCPIYRQERIGRNGRRFNIYKFRSMYQDADVQKKQLANYNVMNGLMFKMNNDPRITKIGKFIRKTSIDELPQFFNVLVGDMSLVGTRPPTVDEFEKYMFHHKSRLSFKPGITGLWQVAGRSSITDFEEIVRLDNKYIETWSIALDIKLIVKTIEIVLTKKGAQ